MKTKASLIDPEWLSSQLLENRKSLREVTQLVEKKYGVEITPSHLWWIAKKYGINLNNGRRRPRGVTSSINPDWLRRQLLEKGQTLESIAQKFGVGHQLLYKISEKYGINQNSRKPSWYARRLGIPELATSVWLLKQKKRGNLGLKNLAAQLKISTSFLRHQIRRLGLNPADFSPQRS